MHQERTKAGDSSLEETRETVEQGGGYSVFLCTMTCLCAIFIAAFWNTISSSFLKDIKLTILAILVGLMQALLLWLAIYSLLYRRSVLRLFGRNVIGKRLQGVVIHPRGGTVGAERKFEIRLRCVKWVEFQTQRDRKTVVEKEVWRHSEPIVATWNAVSRSYEIPVDFQIPGNREPSGFLSSNTRIVWFLEIVRQIPLFKVSFEVPVLKEFGVSPPTSQERF